MMKNIKVMDDLCVVLNKINWNVNMYVVGMIGILRLGEDAKDFYIKKLEETIKHSQELLETIKNL